MDDDAGFYAVLVIVPAFLPLPQSGASIAAFAITTVYGQLVSVYEYPKAVLLVLGGSTAAIVSVSSTARASACAAATCAR